MQTESGETSKKCGKTHIGRAAPAALKLHWPAARSNIKAVLGELLPYSCTGTVLSVIVTVSETDTIW
jgi:hypothetical protein